MQAALAAELARLRAGYMERLPAELAEVARLAGEWAGDPDKQTVLTELHQRLHKFAGSGGTFGYSSLGQACRALELQAKAWLGADVFPDAAVRKAFLAAVEDLPGHLEQPDEPVAAIPVDEPVQLVPDRTIIHVWLVEDDAVLGEQLVRLLGQFGYEVRLLTRMDEAEAAVRKALPDVLLMDVMFSDEGINATEFLLASPVFRQLPCPVLFISAHADFQSRLRAARYGAKGFFTKPLDVPRLVDRLDRIFAERSAVPFRVLVVDDDVVLAEHYRLVLGAAGMEVSVLDQPEGLIDRLAEFRPELVLMDLYMPGCTGPELAQVMRQYDEWLGLPIVYLSAESDTDEQIKALGVTADVKLTP